jgi:hypothetical protein
MKNTGHTSFKKVNKSFMREVQEEVNEQMGYVASDPAATEIWNKLDSRIPIIAISEVVYDIDRIERRNAYAE